MDVIDTVTSPTGEVINIVEPDSVGFAGLDSEAFLQMFITELQNQDPTEPVTNAELMQQLSQMTTLETNLGLEESIESLQTTLEELVKSQSLSAATSFTSTASSLIGQYVKAQNDQGETVEGVVDRALFQDGLAYVGIGDRVVAIEDINEVHKDEPDDSTSESESGSDDSNNGDVV